jgi:alkyl sulfatase BDS1-like metallo-beta-lactamase superfamily hydrolase
MVINWHFTDRHEKLAQTLKHCTLTHRMGEHAPVAAACVITARKVFDQIILGRAKPMEALASGTLKIEGDATRLVLLLAMLEPPGTMMFDILTPARA